MATHKAELFKEAKNLTIVGSNLSNVAGGRFFMGPGVDAAAAGRLIAAIGAARAQGPSTTASAFEGVTGGTITNLNLDNTAGGTFNFGGKSGKKPQGRTKSRTILSLIFYIVPNIVVPSSKRTEEAAVFCVEA
ncbi:hypothetical protein BDQ12DRAFT_670349 [Crucibulum laeve]|uniref:Uncharacterized protein n=1 Tax=Crucibulum laeve TaxID=68775 RepID=A0A5C3LJQ4_9AGAR|nr:hypothetical protein BDQ12DRAFT_670349 [Crucibulum laeve]